MKHNLGTARLSTRENNQTKISIHSPNGQVTDFMLDSNGQLLFSNDGGQTWTAELSNSGNVKLLSAMAESWQGALTSAVYQSDLNTEIANKLKALATGKIDTTGGAVTGAFQTIGANTYLYIGASNSASDTSGDIRLANISGVLQVQLCTVNGTPKGSGTWTAICQLTTIDNLNTQDGTKPLSANQGYVLNQSKVNKTDIVDNLTTQDATKPLSAKQGYVLNQTVASLAITSSGFTNDNVATIKKIANTGMAAQYYSIGDEKNITIGSETITIQIIDFNREGAGIICGMKNLFTTTRQMNSSNTNAGGWSASAFRSNVLPTILSQFPSDWQSAIKAVTKWTANNGNQTGTMLIPTEDKLWLFSSKEVFGINQYSMDGEGTQYALFNQLGWQNTPTSAMPSRVKYLSNGAGSASLWWLRSPYSSDATYFCIVNSSGLASGNGASGSRGVCLGFCI